MPDYKTLYHKTFNAITDTERLIEQASILLKIMQQECEEIVLESDGTPILLLPDKEDT